MAAGHVVLHRRLLLGVGLLLAAALAGMVVLWPSQPPVDEDRALEERYDGTIVAIERFERDVDPELGISGRMADVTVELADGPEAGERIELELTLDGYPPLAAGDEVELTRNAPQGGEAEYYLSDFKRLPVLWALLGLLVGAVLLVGGRHGVRSLLGLSLGLLVVVRFVVPAILAGESPPLVAVVGALTIMIATLYVTHGISEMTTAAVVGTSVSLVLTVGLGTIFVSLGKVTGFASDQAVLARYAVDGLDLQGLVLAGMIIAALGVLDDVTVSQSSTVFALHGTDRRLGYRALFARAMRVGRDHIASVVNTLFLVYAGASLALLVLFHTGGVAVVDILNSEIVAQELIKIVVGSLGLIAAVPITTALAAAIAVRRPAGAPTTAAAAHHHGPVIGT